MRWTVRHAHEIAPDLFGYDDDYLAAIEIVSRIRPAGRCDFTVNTRGDGGKFRTRHGLTLTEAPAWALNDEDPPDKQTISEFIRALRAYQELNNDGDV